MPEGAISLICGGAGDLLDHLDSGDVVTFTGSAATGQQLRAHPNPRSQIHSLYHGSRFTQLLRVRRRRHSGATGIRAVYSGSGPRDDGESRANTAIRRIIVPLAQINAVSDALISRLHKVTVGDPAQEGVKMGPR